MYSLVLNDSEEMETGDIARYGVGCHSHHF